MKKLILVSLVAACANPVEYTEPPPPVIPHIQSDNPAPTVSFTVDCDSNRVCLFDAIATTPPEGRHIEGYGWTFGDASVRVMPAEIPSVQHTYEKSGTYTVYLQVWDDNRMTGRLYKDIEIK